MFTTSDINLASFLILKNINYEIKKNSGRKFDFIFTAENEDIIKNTIKLYYENENRILEYSNILRNIKSQITNLY